MSSMLLNDGCNVGQSYLLREHLHNSSVLEQGAYIVAGSFVGPVTAKIVIL